MIKSFLRIVNPFSIKRRTIVESSIYDEKEFREIIGRERDRVDRHNGKFSLVSFGVRTLHRKENISEPLIRVLLARKLRSIDYAGRCCSGHISVMLHNADSKGAMCYVRNICHLYGNEANPIEFSIFTYPDESKNKGDGGIPECFPSDFPLIGSKKDFERKSFCAKNIQEELSRISPPASTGMLKDNSSPRWGFRNIFVKKMSVWKRIFDIVGSAVCVFIFSPIMLLLALIIKLSSTGPIIFKQKRAGICGRPFTFYKFRSMIINAEEKKKELLSHNLRTGPVFKMSNDPRVTFVGKFIRKWSLDELPQFFNVLKGDMSLVGPRPPTLDEVPEYDEWHKRRLDIKPGITCIWQVYARHNKSFENWVRLDIDYARSQSLLLDLKILFKTIPAVISRKGAC